MTDLAPDIELKFDGVTVSQLRGAPADTVVSSLFALQRLVHLIGMKNEGRAFGQRAKPSAKVRREYSVICKTAEPGSYIQPFDIGSKSGHVAASALDARQSLLRILKAFDSGDADLLQRHIPDARERWFLADAAAGLIPAADSGIEVTVRSGSHGPFAFKATRAQSLIDQFRSGSPPPPGQQLVSGRLKAVDYTNSILTIQPSSGRLVRVVYPQQLESMLQANARRRLILKGDPTINASGDVSGIENLSTVREVESVLVPIEAFESEGSTVALHRPMKIFATFEADDNLFVYQNERLGIDAFSETYDDLRSSVLDELKMLWRNFAVAQPEDLASDALLLREALNNSAARVANDD